MTESEIAKSVVDACYYLEDIFAFIRVHSR